MHRTTLVTLLALGVTLGLSSLAGVAAAGASGPVDTEQAQECTTSADAPTGDQFEVTHPCDVAEVTWCTAVFEDPFGMPQEMPYPCEVTVKTPSTSTTADADVICWTVVEDPFGQPQLAPYPCALQD